MGFFDNVRKKVSKAKKRLDDIGVEKLQETAKSYQKTATESLSKRTEQAKEAAARLSEEAGGRVSTASKAAEDAYSQMHERAKHEAEKLSKESEMFRGAQEKMSDFGKQAAGVKSGFLGEK